MRALIASVLLLAACRGGEEDELQREVLVDEGVSFVAPEGYSGRRDRDTWVLAAEGKSKRATIGIRTVKNDDWSSDTKRGRSATSVIPAVETAMRAFPAARLEPTRKREHDAYEAVEVDLTFTPRSRGGEQYERRHVVLFGEERVIHVFQTAPKGLLAASAEDFARVVDSLREEG